MLRRNAWREDVADFIGHPPLIPLCVISFPETIDEIANRAVKRMPLQRIPLLIMRWLTINRAHITCVAGPRFRISGIIELSICAYNAREHP